jgi:hypothetical protein
MTKTAVSGSDMYVESIRTALRWMYQACKRESQPTLTLADDVGRARPDVAVSAPDGEGGFVLEETTASDPDRRPTSGRRLATPSPSPASPEKR